jgi:hypothetical protein
LYDYETVSLTLRKDYIWPVFRNKVLRRVFGNKNKRMNVEEEVAEKIELVWEQFHNLKVSTDSVL